MSREIRYKFHSTIVEDWLSLLPVNSNKLKTFEFFEKAFNRVFDKASVSMSEITLSAILDRVLYNSAEQFPLLATLQIKNDCLNFTEFKKTLKKHSEKEMKDAFHYMLTEFLCVIGNVTGEQLTPLLHKELYEKGKP
jgi:hypothetical protein